MGLRVPTGKEIGLIRDIKARIGHIKQRVNLIEETAIKVPGLLNNNMVAFARMFGLENQLRTLMAAESYDEVTFVTNTTQILSTLEAIEAHAKKVYRIYLNDLQIAGNIAHELLLPLEREIKQEEAMIMQDFAGSSEVAGIRKALLRELFILRQVEAIFNKEFCKNIRFLMSLLKKFVEDIEAERRMYQKYQQLEKANIGEAVALLKNSSVMWRVKRSFDYMKLVMSKNKRVLPLIESARRNILAAEAAMKGIEKGAMDIGSRKMLA